MSFEDSALDIQGATYKEDEIQVWAHYIDYTPSVPLDFQYSNMPNWVRDRFGKELREAPAGQPRTDFQAWQQSPDDVFAMFNWRGKDEGRIFDYVNGKRKYFDREQHWTTFRNNVQALVMGSVRRLGFVQFNSLDSAPTLSEYVSKYDDNYLAVSIRFKQRALIPRGVDATKLTVTGQDRIDARKSYWGMITSITNVDFDPLRSFISRLKQAPLYGISFYKNRTQEINLTGVNPNPKDLDGRGVPPDYDILHVYPNPGNLKFAKSTALKGGIYSGYKGSDNVRYINAIENMFASDMAARSVDSFFRMTDHAKQTDFETVKNLYLNDVNLPANIDNMIKAPIPVYLNEPGGRQSFFVEIGIPEAIPDPRNGGIYYPQKRLSAIYKHFMKKVDARIADTIGAQAYKVTTPGAPPADLGTPETNIHLVVDEGASAREGKLVYKDISQTPNISYIKGRSFTYGTRSDYDAYLRALEMPKDYLRYTEEGGMGISNVELANLGLPQGGGGIGKWVSLSALAAGAAYLIANR